MITGLKVGLDKYELIVPNQANYDLKNETFV
jgi:hypothetical protein